MISDTLANLINAVTRQNETASYLPKNTRLMQIIWSTKTRREAFRALFFAGKEQLLYIFQDDIWRSNFIQPKTPQRKTV